MFIGHISQDFSQAFLRLTGRSCGRQNQVAVLVTFEHSLKLFHRVEASNQLMDLKMQFQFRDFAALLIDANPVQLTTDPANDYMPAWSPDGREVAFYSLRTGFREIFVTSSAPGGQPVRLTDHRTGARIPRWAPDGLAIVYDLPEDRVALVRRDFVGGGWSEAQVLTDLRCNWPEFSPSGETIACADGTRVMVANLAGNVLWQWTAETGERHILGTYKPDGDLIVRKDQADGNEFELWLVSPTSGAEPSLVLRDRKFPGMWFCCRVTADRAFMTRPELEGDIWVADLDY